MVGDLRGYCLQAIFFDHYAKISRERYLPVLCASKSTQAISGVFILRDQWAIIHNFKFEITPGSTALLPTHLHCSFSANLQSSRPHPSARLALGFLCDHWNMDIHRVVAVKSFDDKSHLERDARVDLATDPDSNEFQSQQRCLRK